MNSLSKRSVLDGLKRAKAAKVKEWRDELPTWCPGCGHFTALHGLYEAVKELIQLPKGLSLIVDEKVCTGCKNTVYSVLYDLNNEGTLYKAKGLQFIVGQIDELPNTGNNNLVLVGKCTAELNQYGRWVPGCPPNNKDLKIEIRGPT